MMQVKTIIYPIDQARHFDEDVNMLLLCGWRITEKNVIAVRGEPNDAGGYPVIHALCAHMEKDMTAYPEEVTI